MRVFRIAILLVILALALFLLLSAIQPFETVKQGIASDVRAPPTEAIKNTSASMNRRNVQIENNTPTETPNTYAKTMSTKPALPSISLMDEPHLFDMDFLLNDDMSKESPYKPYMLGPMFDEPSIEFINHRGMGFMRSRGRSVGTVGTAGGGGGHSAPFNFVSPDENIDSDAYAKEYLHGKEYKAAEYHYDAYFRPGREENGPTQASSPTHTVKYIHKDTEPTEPKEETDEEKHIEECCYPCSKEKDEIPVINTPEPSQTIPLVLVLTTLTFINIRRRNNDR